MTNNHEEYYQKKLKQKARIRKQQKRRISQSSATLSQQIKKGEKQAEKVRKSKVKINLKFK